MITTWLEIGLSNAIVATVLAAVALVVARRLRPRWAFAVWLLVLVKLLMPPLWNAPLGSLRAWLPATETAPAIDWLAGSSAEGRPLQGLSDAPSTEQFISQSLGEGPASADASVSADPTKSVVAILFTAWCVGTAAWCLLAGWRIRTFVLALRRTCCAPGELQEEVNSLAQQLGLSRAPQVRFSRRRVPPMVWSLCCRPTILLPAALLDTLSPPQRTALLMHELVHLRRCDHLAKLVELAALALYWWLPVAWWARRKVEQAAEHCCDAEVVKHLPEATAAYAEALVATIDFLSESSTPLPLGASGFSQFGHVSRRIEMILHPQRRRQRAWLSCLIVAVIVIAALPLSVCTLWAEPMVPSEAARAVTSGDKAADSDKRDSANERDEIATPPASSLAEDGNTPDWNVNYDVDQAKVDEQQAKIEQQLHDIVRSTERNVSLVQTNRSRQEAAIRQAKAIQTAFDSGTVTMDQLLEAQRRVAEAKTSYVRTVKDLYPDSDRKQQLFLEANLMISDEAVNEARRTWGTAYKKYRAGNAHGQAEAESQAREQFYQFKLQRESMLRKWKEVQDRTGKKLSSEPTTQESLTQTDEKRLSSDIPSEEQTNSASNSAKRTVVQNETLRRERTQVRHYELQLRREKLKLKDLEDKLAALEHATDPKDSAQRDQYRYNLESLIGDSEVPRGDARTRTKCGQGIPSPSSAFHPGNVAVRAPTSCQSLAIYTATNANSRSARRRFSVV